MQELDITLSHKDETEMGSFMGEENHYIGDIRKYGGTSRNDFDLQR